MVSCGKIRTTILLACLPALKTGFFGTRVPLNDGGVVHDEDNYPPVISRSFLFTIQFIFATRGTHTTVIKKGQNPEGSKEKHLDLS